MVRGYRLYVWGQQWMDFAQWPYECCWNGLRALDDFFLHIGIHSWNRDNVIFRWNFIAVLKESATYAFPGHSRDMQQTTRVAGINNNKRWFGQKKLFSRRRLGDARIMARDVALLRSTRESIDLWFIRFVDRDVALLFIFWGQQNFAKKEKNGQWWSGTPYTWKGSSSRQ